MGETTTGLPHLIAAYIGKPVLDQAGARLTAIAGARPGLRIAQPNRRRVFDVRLAAGDGTDDATRWTVDEFVDRPGDLPEWETVAGDIDTVAMIQAVIRLLTPRP